jgi:hypothetical protein
MGHFAVVCKSRLDGKHIRKSTKVEQSDHNVNYLEQKRCGCAKEAVGVKKEREKTSSRSSESSEESDTSSSENCFAMSSNVKKTEKLTTSCKVENKWSTSAVSRRYWSDCEYFDKT